MERQGTIAGDRCVSFEMPTNNEIQSDILDIARRIRNAARIVRLADGRLTCISMDVPGASEGAENTPFEAIGTLPGLYPEWLGDRGFAETHGTRFPYIVGEMAQGISTIEMVCTAVENGLFGFFGSAGLPPQHIDDAVTEIGTRLGPEKSSWGANLIHMPQDTTAEETVVDVFLKRGVRRVSTSAFMALAPSIVRFAANGLERTVDGGLRRKHHVFAKISRPEVARQFMSPAPRSMLQELVAAGSITVAQADLAENIPVAEDITVESDSGGHTDNRPLGALFPTILQLRDELAAKFGHQRAVRIGAAGGIGTPGSAAAAFGYGAAYILTGTINQSAAESGLSATGRKMLCDAGLADVAMAPAADMFELGVKVQVLKRGTLFAQRAQALYEIYRAKNGIDDLDSRERKLVEEQILQQSIDDVWARTREYFSTQAPEEVVKAERDPKHKMALVFRWYLFMAADWARQGGQRSTDYQIWCGPAMGAFNDWCRGSFLESPENRTVGQIAKNLLEGAAALTRAHQLRTYGLPVPGAAFQFRPRRLA